MGELGFNKIFGAVLVVFLAVMGLREVSYIVFGGGHHHAHEYESTNKWAEESFVYRVEMAELGGGAAVVEEIYDLGLLLMGADLAKGQRSFEAKCASCHSIEQGGANGTGPNLWDTLGAAKQSHAGFNYSGALANTEGDWSWENMDAWLEAPAKYARGTSMGFAGLKRDDERANVLMYLAQYAPNAPEQPAPLPVIAEEVTEGLEGDMDATDAAVIDADAPVPVEAGTETLEDAVDAAQAEGADAIEAATDAVEAAVEDVTGE